MKTSKLAVVAGALSLCAGLMAGCDTEGPPMPDDTAAIVENEDSEPDEDADDGDDGDGKPAVALAAPTAPDNGLHPCGNAVLDEGEECDDGLANGNDRECTLACTVNDCDLDEHGFCSDPWPAADVDLYPCADLGDHEACVDDLAGQ